MLQVVIDKPTKQVTYLRTSGIIKYRVGRYQGRLYLQVSKSRANPRKTLPANADPAWVAMQPLFDWISELPAGEEITGKHISHLVPKNTVNCAFAIAALRDIGALEEYGVECLDGLSGKPSRRCDAFSARDWTNVQLRKEGNFPEIPAADCKFFPRPVPVRR